MATTEEIRADLAEIVNEVAGVPADDVQLDKSFTDDLDVDSLSMVEVVVAAEEKFGVKHPRRRGQEPQDRRRRRRLHRARPGLIAADTSAAIGPALTSQHSTRMQDPRCHAPRRRHRPRRHHPARRRRRQHLGRPARRHVRRHATSTDDWAEQLPVQIAGRVAVEPTEVLERVKARRLDRSAQFALVAALEAWADAGLGPRTTTVDRERLGVAIASGIGGVHDAARQLRRAEGEGPAPGLAARRPDADAQRARPPTSACVGARAGVHTPVSACASGNEAIALGLDMIRLGRADVVVAGGTEAAIHPLPMAGVRQDAGAVASATTSPSAASRPWDIGRDGFVLGEGAGVLVLESRGARRRPAAPGSTPSSPAPASPPTRTTSPSPTRAARRQRRAMPARARASPTSRPATSCTSTRTPPRPRRATSPRPDAIRASLGEHATDVVVTGTKSMTGHLLGGAGALESIATVLALHHRMVPPTINLDNPDPSVELDIATKARDLPSGDLAALNNSFGFGGHNVAVAFTSAYATGADMTTTADAPDRSRATRRRPSRSSSPASRTRATRTTGCRRCSTTGTLELITPGRRLRHAGRGRHGRRLPRSSRSAPTPP